MPKYGSEPIPDKDGELVLNNREMQKAEFAKRLLKALQTKAWRQSDLASLSGVRRDSVNQYVRGRALPSPSALQAIASALGTRPEDLLPTYFENAHNTQQPTLEVRGVPNDAGYMWLKVNMRLPKKVAMEIALRLQEYA